MTELLRGEAEAARVLGGSLARDEILLRARMMSNAPATQDLITALRRGDATLPADTLRNEQIDRLADGAVVVCAGQQPGLLGGPMMALAKAAAAVRLATTLDSEGIPAVPVFWVASEDHDFVEANRYFIRPDDEQAESSSFHLHARDHDRSLHDTVLDQADRDALRELVNRESASLDYLPRSKETFGSWFSRLFALLTTSSGLIIVEPIWFAAELRAFRRRVIGAREELIELMTAASDQLVEIGFAAPLSRPGPETSFSFLADKDGRQRLDAEPPGWRAGSTHLGAEELDAIIDSDPRRLTSAAAARPLAQQALFPVVAQISGPTEGAYMAQIMPLFGALGLPRPLVRPRPHLLVIDERIRGLARQAGLQGPPTAWSLKAPRSDPGPIDKLIDDTRRLLEGVENHQDPFLRSELVGYRRETMRRLHDLRKAHGRDLKKRSRGLARALHRLDQELRPGRGGQDRVVAPSALGISLDGAFFSRLVAALEADALGALTMELEERQ